jgi:hypothetical protein
LACHVVGDLAAWFGMGYLRAHLSEIRLLLLFVDINVSLFIDLIYSLEILLTYWEFLLSDVLGLISSYLLDLVELVLIRDICHLIQLLVGNSLLQAGFIWVVNHLYGYHLLVDLVLVCHELGCLRLRKVEAGHAHGPFPAFRSWHFVLQLLEVDWWVWLDEALESFLVCVLFVEIGNSLLFLLVVLIIGRHIVFSGRIWLVF